MNIRAIEYFVETVKYENFTKAANSLYVSQPALSKAIQNLEIELNVILIDRNAKEFKLTAEGEKVYAYGKEVLDFFRERTEDLLAELHKKNRELKLGITPTSGAMFFFSVIYPFLHQGAVVTTSRNDVDYVVTEYGIAWLRALTVAERAEALIRLANPDLRDALRAAVEKYELW